MEIDVLFNELSSKVRIDILELLKKGEARFSDITGEVELSSPEVSRHLKRLQEANLIEKLVDGGYTLSLFGETLLRMTSNLSVLVEKSDYFLYHDTSVIPTRLLRDLEPLSMAKVEPVFSMMIRLIQSIGDAKYYWDTSDQMLDAENAILDLLNIDKLEIELRFLTNPDAASYVIKLAKENDVQVHIRTLEDINFTVNVSDKIAYFALPDKNGIIDRNKYIMGDTPEFINWCRDLYLYYWEKAEPY